MENFKHYFETRSIGDQFNSTSFIFELLLGRKSFFGLCQVKAVNAAQKTVDVLPLIMSLDIRNHAIPSAIIYNIPYGRIQAGATAIIIDPVVGDIGCYATCDKDTTNILKTGKQSTRSSERNHNPSDSIYLFSVIGAQPTQYIKMSDSGGIEIFSPKDVNITCKNFKVSSNEAIDLSAPVIGLDGAISQGAGEHGGDAHFSNNLNTVGDVKAGAISLKNHTHPSPGGGNTGTPNP